ncbi:MAG TPA: glycoside hydrolase family 38 C-terminal domain-containing protein, partial [bacterium]|nr:glycoside hydrolase family 38 C-terminal domain-containing protein [bacterium]
QNHGHDSIAGCSRDIVHEDMMFRFRQVREISTCVTERAMMDIVGCIDLSAWSSEDMAVVVFNPATFTRSETIKTVLEIPLEWKATGFEIVDEKGGKVPLQITDQQSPFHQIVQSPNDVANNFPSTRYHALAKFDGVPPLGYRTFRVKPLHSAKKPKQPESMLTGTQSMENEFLSVTINANGTLDILHKETGRLFKNLGYFRDSSERGNPWEHHAVPNDVILTTLSHPTRIALVRDGSLETSFRVSIDWALPEGRSADEKTRGETFRRYPITNTVTLRKGQPWVEVVTELDNTVEDHYLQVCFPTETVTDKVHVQGHFDVVERPVKKPDYSKYDEEPMTEHPTNSFVDLSDGLHGFA